MEKARELLLISVPISRWASAITTLLGALALLSGCAATGGFEVAVEGAQSAAATTKDSFLSAEPIPTSVFVTGAGRHRERIQPMVIEYVATPTAAPSPTAAPTQTATFAPTPTVVPAPAPTALPETSTSAPATSSADPVTGSGTHDHSHGSDSEDQAASDSLTDATTATRRVLVEQQHAPFATIGSLTFVLPSTRVEHVGFHQAIRAGALQMTAVESSVPTTVLASRGRGTGSHTAADIVVEPGAAIVAPVSGVVLSANSYVLYCEHEDSIVVIEPDGYPGWEAKILHISGLQVAPGDRVEAGQTVIASGPTVLPFESQVDGHTSAPAWPHVHIETVDTSVPHESSGSTCP